MYGGVIAAFGCGRRTADRGSIHAVFRTGIGKNIGTKIHSVKGSLGSDNQRISFSMGGKGLRGNKADGLIIHCNGGIFF